MSDRGAVALAEGLHGWGIDGAVVLRSDRKTPSEEQLAAAENLLRLGSVFVAHPKRHEPYAIDGQLECSCGWRRQPATPFESFYDHIDDHYPHPAYEATLEEPHV